MLAVDRTNEKVADLYVPYHPSILKALNKIVIAANKHNKQIALCGDMAHDERFTSFLLGIGLRTLSIDPHYCYRIQQKIAAIDLVLVWPKVCLKSCQRKATSKESKKDLTASHF
ncbi:MAG: putative PEP-binding protein [bacterium]